MKGISDQVVELRATVVGDGGDRRVIFLPEVHTEGRRRAVLHASKASKDPT